MTSNSTPTLTPTSASERTCECSSGYYPHNLNKPCAICGGLVVLDAWDSCEEYIPELDGVGYQGDPTDTERNAMASALRHWNDY